MVKKNWVVPEPSIIAADPGRMFEEVEKCVNAGVKMLHVDIMDGHFVPNLTYGPAMVGALRKKFPDVVLDVHLMLYNPFDWVERFAEKGANHITFHLEATEDIEDTINFIKTCGMTAGLAISPDTSENLLVKYLDKVDRILIMTVHPGFGGQKFMGEMLDKVKFLRDHIDKLRIRAGGSVVEEGDPGEPLSIQVDGGIDAKTGALSVDAGATHLVCGTAFFSQDDYGKAYQELCELGSRRPF